MFSGTAPGVFFLTAFFLFLFVLSASAQSLEDKLSQSRRLQAQSLTGMDDSSLDSLIEMKKAEQARSAGRRGAAGPRSSRAVEENVLDSLIAGPQDPDSLDAFGEEGEFGAEDDSLNAPAGRLGPARGRGPKAESAARARRGLSRRSLPKRYEQRIFSLAPKSLFSTTKSAAGRDYVLGPGDEITVSLWGDKEQEYNLVLNPQGAVFLEGIGLVPLAGSNLGEAQGKLKSRLSRIYSGLGRGTTHVDVALGKAGPIKVFVLGEVRIPGGYVFSGNTSVMSALYQARGPTDIGTVRNLQLNRLGRKYPLDLYQYLLRGENLSPDVLQDGDILFSGRAETLVEISGDVGRPAIYEMKKGEGIKELLEFAGRLNPTSATQKMTLKRLFEDGRADYIDLPAPQEFLAGKKKVELRDGDHLLVERSSETSRNFFTVSGPVKYPGTYAAEGVESVRDLVQKAGGLREDAFLGRVHVVRNRPDGSSELYAYSLDTLGSAEAQTGPGGASSSPAGAGSKNGAKAQTGPSSETRALSAIALRPRDHVILYSQRDMFLPDSVEIAGAVFHPGRYEFRRGMTAKDLVMQAGGFLPSYQEGRLLVFRGDARDRKIDARELKVEAGLGQEVEPFALEPQDFIHVPVDPQYYRKEVVTLEGLFQQPGKYALLYPGEPLASVIKRAGGFKDDAYVQGARFFRRRNNVGRVGVDMHRALRRERSKMNIPLVGGDSIFVPEKSNTVKVVGEVGFETSVLHQEGAPVSYYIERAGGLTRRSEKDRIVIEYANGETTRDGYFVRSPDAGSVILVPQGPEPQGIDWLAGTNALLATTATALTIILAISQLNN